MTLAACAALVERGDPDRFVVTRLAPPDAQARLFPLYAFNLEVARAPQVTAEPMIAEMRLQFWRDVLADAAGGRARAHEVAGPLAEVIATSGMPVAPLDAVVEARRRDVWREPFADAADLAAYLDATAGGLMWAAALALGAEPRHEERVRDLGRAAGLAAWLRAVPALRARGQPALVDPAPEAVRALAEDGLARLAASGWRSLPRTVRPALWPAWQAGPVLRMARAEPARVVGGGLGLSEFTRRWRLLRLGFTGRI